jgi:hypothetical protein
MDRGVYVLSYSKIVNGIYTVTKKGFSRRGIRFYLYVVSRKLRFEKIDIIDY